MQYQTTKNIKDFMNLGKLPGHLLRPCRAKAQLTQKKRKTETLAEVPTEI